VFAEHQMTVYNTGIYIYIFNTIHTIHTYILYKYEKTSSIRNNSEFPPGTVIGLMKVNRRQ